MLDNLDGTSNVDDEAIDDLGDENIADNDVEEAEDDLEEDDGLDDGDDEGESFTLDGEEITADEIREMRQGSLRQSDYTKKTTLLAKSRDKADALIVSLETSIETIESLLGDDSDAELDELLEEGDTAEYLRRDKLRKGKSKKLSDAKVLLQKAFEDKQAIEGEALISSMPEWTKPKTGDSRQKADIAAALSYAETLGFTNDDIAKISDHRVMRALIDAGRMAKIKTKSTSQKKAKVKPTKKPSSRGSGKPSGGDSKNIVDLFYGSKD